MSYDIYLNDPVTASPIILNDPHDMRGGTYQMGGCREAWLNITYNYAPSYYKTLGEKGIRTIYGMTGADSLPLLLVAVANLADDVDDDYWKHTEGNAKRALMQLISLAKLRPDGIWSGD